MANYTLKGRLTEKFNEQQVSDKFKKREFVVETIEEKGSGQRFIENIKFQLVNNNCSAIDNVSVGDEVEVHFNIKGKRFEKDGKVSYFNSLVAWKVQAVGSATTSTGMKNNTEFDNQPKAAAATTTEFSDDLPF